MQAPYIDNNEIFKVFYLLKNAEVVTFETEAEFVTKVIKSLYSKKMFTN